MSAGQDILTTVAGLSYVGIFGIAFLANIVVPVPEEVVILAIGYVAGTGSISFWITFPIVVAGALASDAIMFLLSRRNNPLVRGFYDKFFSKIFPIKQEFLEHHIRKVIFFSRFLVQLRFLGPFLAGQAKATWKKFLGYDIPALIIYVGVLMWAGHYFESRIDRIFDGIDEAKNIVLIIFGIIALWFIGVSLQKLFLGDYIVSFKKKDTTLYKRTWAFIIWKIRKPTLGQRLDFRYSRYEILLKKMYRKVFPIKVSSYIVTDVPNIQAVNSTQPKKLRNFFIRSLKTLKEIRGPHVGDYVEFGVFNGPSISAMCEASKKVKLPSIPLFVINDFKSFSEGEDVGLFNKGIFTSSFEGTQEYLKRKNIDSKNITWIRDWDHETSSEKAHLYGIGKLGMVFIGHGVGASSKAILDFIGPLITQEVIICFDDWKLNNSDLAEDAEYKAFNEFLDTHKNIGAKEIKSYSRKSRAFIIGPVMAKK